MNLKRIKPAILLLVALMLGVATSGWCGENFLVKNAESKSSGPKFVAEEFIVKFKKEVPPGLVRQINQGYGVSVLSVSPRGRFMRLRVPKNKSVEQMVSAYAKNPHVQYAQPNYVMRALMTPNDQYYNFQWHLKSINMESAWDLCQGDPNVIVAVVDTGVANRTYTDPFWGFEYPPAPDLVNTKFVPGYDFINKDPYPDDDHGHGTHVTGTIAQSTNNVIGVAGIAFKTAIMPVKVLDYSGSGANATVADGIYYAADHGAKVINLSLGDFNDENVVREACAYAYNKGVTIVCAAGNDYQTGNRPMYPAAYNEFCIAVGATRFDQTRSFYSNTGAYLDLAAPGGDTSVDQNADGYPDGILQNTYYWYLPPFMILYDYVFMQGTSMASPHVAGVAALLVASGVSGPDKVREALEKTAKDRGQPGWDPEYGWGIVDAYAALTYNAPKSCDVAVTGIAATPSTCLQGDSVSVVATLTNQGGSAENFPVALKDLTSNSEIALQQVSLGVGQTQDVTFTWNTSGAAITSHTLEARAEISDDNAANNFQTTTVMVQELKRPDVAVTGLDAPSTATLGTQVKVTVTVANQGTIEGTTTVSLQDSRSSIGSVPGVTLAPGEQKAVVFTWDTSTAGTGDHTLMASASAADGETNTLDNSMETPIKLVAPAFHVSGIDMALGIRSDRKTKYVRALATVSIVDASGAPVSEAAVTGQWSGATTSDTISASTGADGKVTFTSAELTNPPKRKTTFIFTVNGVAKDDWEYDAKANIENQDRITY